MLRVRKHPRVPLEVKVTVFGPEGTADGETREIGAGGMSLSCTGKLSVSHPVELAFALPEGPTLRLAAVVWWKKDGLIGFRFDFTSKERTLVERWVNDRLQHAKYFSKPI